MAGSVRDRVMARLWPAVPRPAAAVWAVLDGARDDRIFTGVRDSGLDFLRVRSEADQKLIFRYYDPRVLRAYLPTCNAVELRTVFGPVRRYLIEAEDPAEIIEYTFDGTRLDIRRNVL